MNNTKIAIYGGSFNPPGIHHIDVVKTISKYFERIIIVPCGFRNDKINNNNIIDFIEPCDRREMIKISFENIAELDFFDLDNKTFTRTIDLYKRYKSIGDIWFVVGSDLIIGGKDHNSDIEKNWQDGMWLWNNLNFIILNRKGFQINKEDLPPHYVLIEDEIIGGSSSDIRKNIRTKNSIKTLVTDEVASYILENNLYVL